jgi:hypothetical protein
MLMPVPMLFSTHSSSPSSPIVPPEVVVIVEGSFDFEKEKLQIAKGFIEKEVTEVYQNNDEEIDFRIDKNHAYTARCRIRNFKNGTYFLFKVKDYETGKWHTCTLAFLRALLTELNNRQTKFEVWV